MPVLVIEPTRSRAAFTPTPSKKKRRGTGTPFEEAAVRTVELAADNFHEDARASMVHCNRYLCAQQMADKKMSGGIKQDTAGTVARLLGDARQFGGAVFGDQCMVMEGDTLLHLLLRNDAHKDTVEACLRGGADVSAVNARGEQVLGLAKKAAARSGQKRHHGPGASAEARERRLHAEGVVVVIEKSAARRNPSGKKQVQRRARLNPGGPRSPNSPASSRRRRSASPIRPRTAPEVSASKEVDAWRRVASRAHVAADAIEQRFRDAWTMEDAEKAARTAQNDDVVVAAVRGAVAEALTARGEDDDVPERATARLDRDLEHVKAERDVARARFNRVKKAYDEVSEERRKREEQIERDRVRRMNRQAPENATTERLVRQKLERERDDARREVEQLVSALRDERRAFDKHSDQGAQVREKLNEENKKWREWYKQKGDSLERFGRRKVQAEIDATRARLRDVLDKVSASEAANVRRSQELDAREKTLRTMNGSDLNDEQRWGRSLRCELTDASVSDATRITSQLLANDDASRAAAYRTPADVFLKQVEAARNVDAPVAFVAPDGCAYAPTGASREGRAVYASKDGASLAFSRDRWTWRSVSGDVVCASASDALLPPLTDWVNADADADPNWSLAETAHHQKQSEFPAPLDLRLMEVDALQKAVALESLACARLDAQLSDGAADGVSRKQLETKRDQVRASRDASLARLADQVFVETCTSVAPDLSETCKRYDALYRTLLSRDPSALVNLRQICSKMAPHAEKKLRQRLSSDALRFCFSSQRTSAAPADAYDVRFALGLLKDAVNAKPQFDDELRRIGAEAGATVLIAPVKSLGRAFAKVHEKYGGRYDGVTDLVRGTLQCDSLQTLEACAKALAQSVTFKVVRVKNRLDPAFTSGNGYRDVLCNVKVGAARDACCVGEVQLNLAPFVDIKEGAGHACYEAARAIHHAENDRHVGTAASWALKARERCTADEARPLCLAERVASGQLTALALKADASTPFPGREDLRRSLESPFARLRTLRLDGLNGFLEVVLTPNALVALSQCLEELVVGGKDLGPLPDLSQLKRLRALRLRGARGPLDLDQLSNGVQSLTCTSCRGFGKLPRDLGRVFPQLQALTLRQCQLEGPLPGYFGDASRFPKLRRLDLSSNALTGYVDAALFRGPSLESVDVSKNALKGAEPSVDAVVSITVNLGDLKTHGNAWDEGGGVEVIRFDEVVNALAPPPPPAAVAEPGGDPRLLGLYHVRGSRQNRARYCAASGASIEFRAAGPALGPHWAWCLADGAVVATARPDDAPSETQWRAACGTTLLTGAAPPLEFSAPSDAPLSPSPVKESQPEMTETTAAFSAF